MSKATDKQRAADATNRRGPQDREQNRSAEQDRDSNQVGTDYGRQNNDPRDRQDAERNNPRFGQEANRHPSHGPATHSMTVAPDGTTHYTRHAPDTRDNRGPDSNVDDGRNRNPQDDRSLERSVQYDGRSR